MISYAFIFFILYLLILLFTHILKSLFIKLFTYKNINIYECLLFYIKIFII